jgi:phage terminase large subunit
VSDLKLPHLFKPRHYQREAWLAMRRYKRAYWVWHRRSGKDTAAWNYMIYQAVVERPGTYYYLLPTYAQAKKTIWDGIGRHDDNTSVPMRAHIPAELLVTKPHETEMKITVKSRDGKHSIIQLIGTDNFDSVMGTNPVGLVASEYSLQNPKAWDYMSPILAENDGWAIFVTTPRGHNHAWKLWQNVTKPSNADVWYTSLLTVRDTRRLNGEPVITAEAIDRERAEGRDEETIQQEYYCSFEGSMRGAYYASWLDAARKDGRIGKVPYEPLLPVYTAWDIGVGDATAIWFYQMYGKEIRFIDTYDTEGEGLPHFAKYLQNLPYVYAPYHLAPHDIKVKEFGTGKTRIDMARQLGIRFRIAPKLDIEEGIEAVRGEFPKYWFDQEKCDRGLTGGLTALATYRKLYDEARSEFKREPYHDWSSHYADAIRTRATGHRDQQRPSEGPRVHSKFDVFDYDHEIVGMNSRRTVKTDFDPHEA